MPSPLARHLWPEAADRAMRQRTSGPITYTAACPDCGADATWTTERNDTRVETTWECPCRAEAVA